MNIVDVILILIVLFCIWNGWQKGFIAGITELILLVAGLLFAFFSYPYTTAFLQNHWSGLGALTVPLSFIFALVVIRIIFSFAAQTLVRQIPQSAHDSIANRLMGMVPGVINGLIFAAIAAAVFLSVPFSRGISTQAPNSLFVNKLKQPIEWVDNKFSPVFEDAVSKVMNKTAEPDSEKGIFLPFKDASPKERPDLEAKMLDLVNEERLKAGLRSLKLDPQLLPVARAHSADMLAKGYFSHINPEGKSPFDRMKKAGVRFMTAGENLAVGQTLLICHRGLMNSSGHRANILNSAFGRVGIGILDAGIYGLMITQDFRN